MKKKLLLLLLCCSLVLGGCMAAPPDSLIRTDADPSALIGAQDPGLPHGPQQVSLYFRYQDTAYLAPEQRMIAVGLNESLEMALVQALVEGPSATQSDLVPLFPAGTEVLSVTGSGDTLFVSFNEALLDRYSDEPKDLSGGQWRVEAPLRRRLCMDSLTATLTAAGLCTRVEVLVHRKDVQQHSMRLSKDYFLTGEEGLLDPLTRREDSLLTPHNAAGLLLRAWMTQDWERLYTMTAGEGRPGEQGTIHAFSAARTLVGYTLSPGEVSPDGKSAILSVDMVLRGSGEDVAIAAYPVLLTRQDGIWKMDYSRLLAMMNAK